VRIDANYATLVLNALCLEGLAASMRYSVYLLYWYKSTNTHASDALCLEGLAASMRYSVYLLYWYKGANTAAEGAARL
jgi:hypothetical protein